MQDGDVKQGDVSVYEFQEVPIASDPKMEQHGNIQHYAGGSQMIKKKTIQRTKYPGTVQVGANGEKRKIYQCSECAFYSHRWTFNRYKTRKFIFCRSNILAEKN